MKKILIITKYNDLLIPFFLTQKILEKIEIDFLLFIENNNKILEKLKAKKYDYVFIRDPFNAGLSKQEIKIKIKLILENINNAYSIDNIDKVEDVFFEDKWEEYRKLSKFIPKTKILESKKEIDFKKHFVKKRFSSAGKGIVFDITNIDNPREYIIQAKMDIKKEYRVYTLFNEIIDPVAVKTSKTPSTTIKIIKAEEITQELYNFVKIIKRHIKFDFIGFDIAKLQNGEYKLVEINRSCWIAGYYRVTGINLAEKFIDKLLNENHLIFNQKTKKS